MTTSQILPASHAPTTDDRAVVRTSAKIGIAFTICQLIVMVAMTILVLPHGGSPSDPAIERGQGVYEAANWYRWGNWVFMLSGTLLLGFLGAVHVRLRHADGTGVLATIAVAAGTLVALIWPMGGMLHEVALETARAGTDLRILAGWDSVAPYTLAFSALPRFFFVGAIIIGLRRTGAGAWLQRTGVVLLVLALVGSLTPATGAVFPILALGSLAFEVWVGALAWHWLRNDS